jgi:hypothetical protein
LRWLGTDMVLGFLRPIRANGCECFCAEVRHRCHADYQERPSAPLREVDAAHVKDVARIRPSAGGQPLVSRCIHEGVRYMESREDCLHEASECDRLAKLANTQATRTLLAVAAFQWRKLAEKAAERKKRSWPLVPEAASIAVAGGLVDCLSAVCLRVS